MCLMTARKTDFRKTSSYGPFAAVMVLASSSVMCAQSSQPSACNLDSDGFCVTGAVQAAPLLSHAPQNKLQLESSPAPHSKPQVEFRDDLLRINAENTTLRDTLKAVSARTGAEMQFPAGELEERIFVHLGPGSAREVVTQLLNGTAFNYVILSSASEPGGIMRVILSRRTGVNRENVASEAPAIPANESAAPQLYGAAFGVDPDTPAAGPVPSQAAAATAGATPAASWIHNDGAKLSGEDLDRMQKMQIQQEQQQLAQQAQQQRQQQQEQPSQTSSPQ
jgi:hypothetical protein